MFEWLTGSQSLVLAAIIVPLAGFTLSGSGNPDCVMTTATSNVSTSSAITHDASARGTVAGNAAEEAGVRVALNAYLDGHRTGQADAFRRAFHPDARMVFVRDGKFVKTEIADYIANAPGKPADDEAKRHRRIDSIDIVGDAAIAKITLDYPEVTFTDYMTLLKIDNEWRIVGKAFSADRSKAANKPAGGKS